jgi:hypothetical protein
MDSDMKHIRLHLHISLLILSFLARPSCVEAQIVNIESERIQTDSAGWAGSAKLGMHASKDVEGSLLLQSQAHLQYKSKDHLVLVKGSMYVNKGGGETFSENSFLHFRYNYNFLEWLRWEAYTQVQKNQIAGIEFRSLAGTGPRFKIIKDSGVAVYAALSYLFEHQNEEYPVTGIVHKNDHRFSAYVSYTMRPAPGVAVVQTVYYQPLLKTPADYRLFSDLNLSFAVTKMLGFSLNWQAVYDSTPVPGKPRFTYVFENQIQITFGGKE